MPWTKSLTNAVFHAISYHPAYLVIIAKSKTTSNNSIISLNLKMLNIWTAIFYCMATVCIYKINFSVTVQSDLKGRHFHMTTDPRTEVKMTTIICEDFNRLHFTTLKVSCGTSGSETPCSHLTFTPFWRVPVNNLSMFTDLWPLTNIILMSWQRVIPYQYALNFPHWPIQF